MYNNHTHRITVIVTGNARWSTKYQAFDKNGVRLVVQMAVKDTNCFTINSVAGAKLLKTSRAGYENVANTINGKVSVVANP